MKAALTLVTMLLLGSAAWSIQGEPAQLVIEARFVEFDDPLDALDAREHLIDRHAGGTSEFPGTLPPSKYRALMNRLEQKTGVDLLTAPKVTTVSGRHARIKIAAVRQIWTGFNLPGAATNLVRSTSEPFELGPTLDVVPSVQADGVTIHMTIISTVREFVGYEFPPPPYFDSGPPKPLTPAPIRDYLGQQAASTVNPVASAPPREDVPKPIFRLRQTEAKLNVWDGQTAVLPLEVKNPATTASRFRYKTSGKTCLVFVTATLVDPAGNRLNPEADLPFAENSIPR